MIAEGGGWLWKCPAGLPHPIQRITSRTSPCVHPHMTRPMQTINVAPGAMVGILAVYTYIQQAVQEVPSGLIDLLLGNVGTLVLSLVIGFWLYKANQRKDRMLEQQTNDLFNDMKSRLDQVTRERNEYLAELLQERKKNRVLREASRKSS